MPAPNPKTFIPERFASVPQATLPPRDPRTEAQIAEMRAYAGTGRGQLLDLAKRGQPRPQTGPLAILWSRSQDPQSWDYDLDFLNLIREIRPGWL
jgi:hypothetical protein